MTRVLAFVEYSKNRIKISRFFWHFWKWYSISGKSKIMRTLGLKTKLKLVAGISLTNVCNAKCVFCVNSKITLKPKIMSYALYRRSVNQIVDLGENEINLIPTVGDTLMDKNADRKIAYAKSKGLRVNLITNGILLENNENYKKIVDSGVDNLMLSVGDIDENYDSRIYGITVETSKKRWEGIYDLLQYAMKVRPDLHIHISFRPMRPPYQITKSKMFKNFMHFKNVSFGFLFCYDNWCGMITQCDLLGIMHLSKGPEKHGTCIGLYQIMIMPDGKVRLCGCRIKNKEEDELVIGDINNSTLQKLLKSERVERIRENFLNGLYPDLCKKCTFYNDSENVLIIK